MHEEAAPTFTGHVAWRGTTPVADLPAQFNSHPMTIWLGPGRHITHFPVGDGEQLAFTAVVETAEPTEESWYQKGDRQTLVERFQDWHPVIQTLVGASRDLHSWPLYDRAPLARWTDGHVTLLGDACHPALPYLSQGAALAIEDAWVLSRMLETWEEDIASGLAEYERYRRPRAARVQVSSRQEGRNFHLSDRWQIRWRNLRMALSSRYLPEIAMERYDWLYGYDCVKGFD
jgi:salicylate hydroxylase